MERSNRSSKVLVDDKEKIFGEGNENIQWFGKMMKKHAQKVIDANNISNCSAEELAKCKFTFLEPSPAQEMLEQLQKKGQQFVDQSFPANKASLDGNYPYPDKNMQKLWPSIQWRKISEVLPQSKIFKGDIEPNDIQQGSLGDCYFLAALSALAERQYRIFNLFLLKEVNNVKYYSVRILYRGKWRTIDLDEYIPWLHVPQYGYNNRPAFAKTSQNQLWVILLEKAYAKLYGCFTKINGGSPLEPLQAMTGGNPVRLEFKSNQQIQENWKYLEEATRLHYPMVAASHGQGETIGKGGIVAGHAYTLLSVWTINGKDRVVKLRNPWGNQEWQGQWSDGDNNSWNQVGQSQKNRIGFKNAQDGIFFMPYYEFVRAFVNVELVQMNDNYSYVYKSIAGNYPQGIYFKINIPKQGKYSIQNYTTPHRKLYPPGQMPTSFAISYLNVLYRLSDRQSFKSEAKFGSAMNYTIYTLTPGQYLYHTIQKFDQYQKQFEINVAVYSQYAAEIKIATPQEVGKLGRFCNWNPPQLQEQYRADNQAKKQSNNTGLTSKEAEKLAALERLRNMGGNNQAPQNNVVPEKKVTSPQPQPQPKPQPPVPKIPENQGWNGWDDPPKNQGFGGNGGNLPQPSNNQIKFNNNGWDNDDGWDDNSGNQGNQGEWTLISTNQQSRTSVNHFGQRQTMTKITKVYRNKQGQIMQEEQIISQIEETTPQGFGWSNKYQFW